jgi:hypothetical protein
VEGSREHGNEPGFHKMLRISCVAAQLAASQEGLSSMSEYYLIIIKYFKILLRKYQGG